MKKFKTAVVLFVPYLVAFTVYLIADGYMTADSIWTTENILFLIVGPIFGLLGIFLIVFSRNLVNLRAFFFRLFTPLFYQGMIETSNGETSEPKKLKYRPTTFHYALCFAGGLIVYGIGMFCLVFQSVLSLKP